MTKPREWFLNGAAWAPKGRLIAYTRGQESWAKEPSIHVVEASAYRKAVECLRLMWDSREVCNHDATDAREAVFERLRATLEKLGELHSAKSDMKEQSKDD